MRHLFYILSALFLFGCGSDTDGLRDSNDQSIVVYSGLKTDDWIKTRESKLLNSYKLTLTDLNLTSKLRIIGNIYESSAQLSESQVIFN